MLFTLRFALAGAGVGIEDAFKGVELTIGAVTVAEETTEEAAATGDDTLVTKLAARIAPSLASGVETWVTRLRETGAGCGGMGADVFGCRGMGAAVFGLNLAVAGETRTAKAEVSAWASRRG